MRRRHMVTTQEAQLLRLVVVYNQIVPFSQNYSLLINTEHIDEIEQALSVALNPNSWAAR